MFKRLRKTLVAGALLTAALAGPAGASLTSEAGGGTATLVLSKGYKAAFGRGAMVAYSLSSDGRCDDWKLMGRMTWATGNSRTEKVGAGTPVAVHATTEYFYPTVQAGQNSVYSKRCDGVARFTPQAGHTYEIVHETPFDGKCRLIVTDKDTQVAPPGLTYPRDECLFRH
ncbi:MAG TPA: hypothetical protein VG407_08660 [Caulobacteraceae bacterium]|jgi:hypothetical protein|nr:hypothetical protein [Caulobacteraceae bacterium]